MEHELIPLSPFQEFCVKFLGYTPSAYEDCYTYLECLVYTYNYLKNEIVPSVNAQNEVIQEMKDYIDHYFDNLDVQEEINNKLDAMVEDGTLQDIITAYLQVSGVLAYNNVNNMKSATNLIDGSITKTLGYHEINDGGAATYKVRTITNDDVVDNMFIIPLSDNNLIAELIITSSVNVDSLGAKGNGTDDDTDIIQAGIDYCIENKKTLISSGNKTYLISETLDINGIVNIDFNNSTIITNEAIKMIDINHSYLKKGGYIKNIVINMNSVATHGIYCTVATKQLISNVEINNITNIGFELNDGVELIFENSHLRGSTTGTSAIGLKLNRGDSHYKDIIMIDCHTAIDNRGSNFFDRIHAWILTPTLIKDSIFMDFRGTRSFLSQCYSDTYNIGFKIRTDGRLRLVEHNNYYNPDILTAEIIGTFTDGVVYMFYYDNASYTRQTTITNSYIQGYANNTSLGKLTNVANNDNRIFIDSQTRVANWSANFKTLDISISELATQSLSLSGTGKIRSINNLSLINMVLTNGSQINANTTISNVYTLPSLLRPLQNERFAIPVTSGSQESTVYTYCICSITTGGVISISTPVNITANSNIYLSRTYICDREP